MSAKVGLGAWFGIRFRFGVPDWALRIRLLPIFYGNSSRAAKLNNILQLILTRKDWSGTGQFLIQKRSYSDPGEKSWIGRWEKEPNPKKWMIWIGGNYFYGFLVSNSEYSEWKIWVRLPDLGLVLDPDFLTRPFGSGYDPDVKYLSGYWSSSDPMQIRRFWSKTDHILTLQGKIRSENEKTTRIIRKRPVLDPNRLFI